MLSLETVHADMRAVLVEQMIPFWLRRAPDPDCGGYFTEFDASGTRTHGRQDKCLVTQARLVWFFSSVAELTPTPEVALDVARAGFEDLVASFHDVVAGGWRWRVARTGQVVDAEKVVYGQSFALFALASYARATGDACARALACSSFDHLVSSAVDTTFGGFRELLDSRSAGLVAADRKTLDTHLHLLESFAEVVRLTGSARHVECLAEVRDLILLRMIDPATGAGGDQYDRRFRPVAPVALDRTWIAERLAGPPTQRTGDASMTSYGHNLELAWLLGDADVTLGQRGHSDAAIAGLARHALAHGVDRVRGGVYREGPAAGEATDLDKEFWQNAEGLVGLLEGHRVTGDDAFLDAFVRTWQFAAAHLIHPEHGEWCVRVTETGDMVDDHLGNTWKNCYHTGRAMLECLRRLDGIVGARR